MTGGRQSGRGNRLYLDVPYAEKDEAKALGARWDPQIKRWYDPRPPTAGLDRWAARPSVPDLLPAEDRTFGAGLFVDMVPRSCWFTNVRTCVSPQDWERLRRMITRRAGQKCEVCGAGEDRTVQRWLEAHERWAYDEQPSAAPADLLVLGMPPVDPPWLCQRHRPRRAGSRPSPRRHWHDRRRGLPPRPRGQRPLDSAVRASVWTLDLTMLTEAGVTLARPEKSTDRPAAAEWGLRRAHQRDPILLPAQRHVEPATLPPPSAPPAATPSRRGLWERITGR
ncbi:DUF5710 domain-containing protein [Pseudonocardia sichuanensis]